MWIITGNNTNCHSSCMAGDRKALQWVIKLPGTSLVPIYRASVASVRGYIRMEPKGYQETTPIPAAAWLPCCNLTKCTDSFPQTMRISDSSLPLLCSIKRRQLEQNEPLNLVCINPLKCKGICKVSWHHYVDKTLSTSIQTPDKILKISPQNRCRGVKCVCVCVCVCVGWQ